MIDFIKQPWPWYVTGLVQDTGNVSLSKLSFIRNNGFGNDGWNDFSFLNKKV
jgi:hypothetical protein